MKAFIAAGLICMVLALPSANAGIDTNADAILGIWQTTRNKSQVRIFKRNEQYFGEIVSLKDPNWSVKDKAGTPGQPKTDRHNPDLKLRDRPIIGLEIMSGFLFAGKNHWKDGQIYDPESGKTYSCKMKLKKPNELEVRGFIGLSILGRTVVWTR